MAGKAVYYYLQGVQSTGSIKNAVFTALKRIGDRTSVSTLQAAARKIGGVAVDYGTAVYYRRQYRTEKKLATDCRTYVGQPRRDMLADKAIQAEQLGLLDAWLRNNGIDGEPLVAIAKRFHSVPQFVKALTKADQRWRTKAA